MDFNTNYNLALTFVDDTTPYWNFMAFNETTGATLSEMTVALPYEAIAAG